MRPVVRMSWGFIPRLATLYAALFLLSGVQMPFFPIWLQAKNVDAKVIGIILAVPMIARVLAIPLVTREADRRDAVRDALVIASLASVAGYVLVGLSGGGTAILITYTLTALFSTPLMPLAETYALNGLLALGRAYGPVRLWGSLAFIVGNFAAGFAADEIPARHLIWLMVAGSALIGVAAWQLVPLAGNPPQQKTEAPQRHGPLWDHAFVAVLAGASLIQASHALFYGFSAVQWHGAGLDGTFIAALWALGVAAEIALFAVQGRLPPFLTPTAMLMIGAFAGTLRWLSMALDPPALVLPWLQILHALSFGATHLGALMFLAQHAPTGKAATAQGHLAIAAGLAMAVATGISGVLFADFGSGAYIAMALAAVAGGACGFVAHRIRRESAR
jgi:MFS transporter, PPP family, 3-phenylpropionic acid transporter